MHAVAFLMADSSKLWLAKSFIVIRWRDLL